MPTYTVHAPPTTGTAKPERFLFLRDGFHFWAFVAPPLWMLLYRQWLALLIYLVVSAAALGGLAWIGASAAAVVAAGLCISLLVGFEAASIRRWSLARGGWSTLGFVVGEDADVAERRFFVRWAERSAARAPQQPSEPAQSDGRITGRFVPEGSVIGLFPQPDPPR